VAYDQSEERGVDGARDGRGSGASGVGGARDEAVAHVIPRIIGGSHWRRTSCL
jgi:hypothetical protein